MRAVCFVGDQVVLVRTEHFGVTVVPGGGREPGEGIEDALRRELMEEAGATVLTHEPLVFIRHRSHAAEPHRPHYSHPVVFMGIWLAEVRLDHAPTQPPDGERIVGVEPLDAADAVAELLAEPAGSLHRESRERQVAILQHATERRGAR